MLHSLLTHGWSLCKYNTQARINASRQILCANLTCRRLAEQS